MSLAGSEGFLPPEGGCGACPPAARGGGGGWDEEARGNGVGAEVCWICLCLGAASGCVTGSWSGCMEG